MDTQRKEHERTLLKKKEKKKAIIKFDIHIDLFFILNYVHLTILSHGMGACGIYKRKLYNHDDDEQNHMNSLCNIIFRFISFY